MLNRILLILLVTGLLLVACAPSTSAPITSTDDTTPTAETNPEAIDMDDPLVQDATFFAEDQGITLEEALQRLKYQQTIGDIQPSLEADLPDTYGGLWIEHQPKYRIIIALTAGTAS